MAKLPVPKESAMKRGKMEFKTEKKESKATEKAEKKKDSERGDPKKR